MTTSNEGTLPRVRITGTGAFAPPRIVSNHYFEQRLETSDAWITSRTGIKNRHLVDHYGHMASSDLALPAAQQALEAAGLDANDLDLIVVGTVTPDLRCPSCASILQHKLGARSAVAFDVSAACAGSMFALAVAEKFVKVGASKRALVVGVETLSSITNWSDRNTCVLFGDGAGACVLEPSTSPASGMLDLVLYTDGQHWEFIHIPVGGSRTEAKAEHLGTADRLHMNGREVYKFAVRALAEAAQTILARNNLRVDDVTVVCAHQANLRIIEGIAERVHIPLERFVINIDRYGNTSSASALLTLDEGVRTGRVKPGDLVLMLAIGAGMVWSAALYRA